jgi:hypothetical protein
MDASTAKKKLIDEKAGKFRGQEISGTDEATPAFGNQETRLN